MKTPQEDRLNAPTGAWCSLTAWCVAAATMMVSQCTYRCVVLPDHDVEYSGVGYYAVSMHLQVRGAP